MQVDAHGALILETAVGEVRLLQPGIYQTVHGARRRVPGHYVLLSENRVGFEVAPYDKTQPLVIDPTLVYSTYLGGSSTQGDEAFGIAVDSTGNAYVTGRESSADFPGSGVFHVDQFQFIQFNQSIFVTKFNPAGNTLLYSTLINGASSAASGSGFGIAVDSIGAAYVVGNTNAADFPTVNPFQATLGNSGESSFVMKLGPDGSTIVYSTYLGGRNVGDSTNGNAIALDSSKNAYVTGDTNSFNFPTASPLQVGLKGFQNAFVAKFDTNGQPVFSTYLGGSGGDQAFAIAVDSSSSAYVTGQTTSSDFPVAPTGTAFQATRKGFQNAFVTKLNPAGNALVYSTYLGGSNDVPGASGQDAALGIAVDSTGNAYVTGQTDSTDFPVQNPIQSTNAGSLDAFVTKMNPTGTAPLVYSTYLGGSKNDFANGISLDGSNNAYVTGGTESSDFKLANPLQGLLGGTRSVFVTSVKADGSGFNYSTYLGGNGLDKGQAIVADTSGNAYVAGQTTSVNFPILGPFQSQLFSSAGNAFVAKISPTTPANAVTLFPSSFNFGSVGLGSTSFTEPITMTNNTASTVTGITPSIAGTNPTDFAIAVNGTTCTAGSSLTAGASCVIMVTFSPTVQDNRSATLSVSDSGPGSPQTVPLTGFGGVPEVSLSVTSINFGNQPLNIPTTNGVQVTNTGSVPVHGGSLLLSGPNAADFSVNTAGCQGRTFTSGTACFVSVTFEPTAAGARSATLSINDDAADSPQTVALSGTGVAEVIAIPTTVNFFTPQIVGTTSPFPFGATLENGSGGTITLNTSNPAGVVDSNTTEFPFATNPGAVTCTNGLVMAAGATCIVSVNFSPTAAGNRTGSLSFNYTGFTGSPVVVNLTGVGLTGVQVLGNPFNFGNGFVGFPRTIFGTLVNGTTSPLNVTSIVMGGTNSNDFTVALDPSCPSNSVLAANTTCTLDLTFRPGALGARSATATLNFSGPPGSPIVLNLSGTGVPGPVFLSTNKLAFGAQLTGETSPPLRVVLNNDSKTADLHISTVVFSGGGFSALPDSTCVNGLTVKIGGSCFVDVVFAPPGVGPSAGTLTFTDDGPGSPRVVNLTGIGQAPAITTSVNKLDFGNQTVGQTSSRQTVFLINGSNATITSGNATIGGTNASEFTFAPNRPPTCVANAKVLGEGGTCSVDVIFSPTAIGTRTATLTINDSDAGSPRMVNLTGNGVLTGVGSFSQTAPVTAPVTSTSASFGPQPAGTTSAAKSVTLFNIGNGPLTIVSIGAFSGQNAADFKIDSGTTCAGNLSIPSGGSCLFNLTFTPPDTSTQFPFASFTITTNGGNGISNAQAFVSLSGQAVAAGLVASPSPLNFGTVALGASAFGNLTVTNGTSTTLTLDTANTVVNGQNPADFTLSPPFCQPLAAGGNCFLSLTFAPGAAGARSANLHIVFTGSPAGASVDVPLAGTGAATVVASPNPVTFPTTSFGSTSFQDATVANGTGSTVTLGATSTITGPNASDFSISSNSCTPGNQLTAFGCSINVNFNPTAAGNRSAQFSVSYTGASGSPLVINLSGSATSPSLVFSSSNLNFPTQLVNTQSAVQTLTLTNTGNSFFNTSSIRLAGTNGNDFALAGGTCVFGAFLAPNSSCTLTVNFTPSSTGSRAGTLTFTDNAPGSPHIVTLNGNGQAGSVSVAPNSLDFGSQNINTTSAVQAVTLKNTLNGPTTITGVSLSGANANQFTLASGTTCTVNSTVPSLNGVCVVNITFNPTQVGSATALLTITDSLGGGHGVNLTGTGANPVVTVTPSQVSFGNQLVGTHSATITVTLNNGSASAVTISSAPSTTGTNASEFTILGTSTCASGANIPATTGACKVDIQFTPAGTGNRSATLTIADAPDGNSPHQVALSGVGTQPGALVAPTTINFGNVTVTATVSQSATLTNNGSADLNLQTIVFTGANSGDFVADNTSTCKAGIVVTSSGGSCTLTIDFTPAAQGNRTATVTFTDNASPTTQAATLSGNGVPATVTLAPSPLNFGNQHKGAPSSPMTITLTNTANSTLHLAASNPVQIVGTNAADFTLATGTTCTGGASVTGPSGTCIINIIFTPSTAAAETATLTVTDDASPTTQSVTLNGTGTFPQASVGSLDFGNQRQGVTSATKTLTLTNGGNENLQLAASNAVVLGGANASGFSIVSGSGTTCLNSATVTANGGTCTVAVTFTPSALGLQTATITFTDNANPTTQVANLQGTGVFPQASPAPNPLDFGNQRKGVTSATKTVTLTNNGTDTLHLNANNAVALAPGSDFAIVAGAGTTCTNGGTVAAIGGTCTVAVTFTPTQTGARTGSITFTDDASPTTQVVNLTGNGIFPQAALAPNPLTFGTQAIGFTSAPMIATLSNPGTDDLHLAGANAVTVSGANQLDFTIVSGAGTTCTNGAVVKAGQSCTINVTVKPSVNGAETATLTVTDDANPATQSITLSATGTTATAVLSPSPVNFPNTHKGSTSAAITVTLTNISSSSITLSAAPSISGANQADFAIVNGAGTTCVNGAMLAANTGTCTLAVTFTPSTAAAEAATLSVSDTAVPSTQTVTLNGTGTFPQASASPNPLAFGNQRENTGVTKTITITNNGNETLHISSEAITGTNMNDFATASGTTCTAGSTVAANGGTCVYTITYTPTTLTAESATLTFNTDANPSAVAVSLTGTGVFPQATPNPTPLAFGPQRRGTSVTKTVTLSNGGTDTLHISTVAISGTNGADFVTATGTTCTNNSTVAPSSSCVYNVTFTPSTLTAETATLTFNTDANPAVVQVSLTGTGTFPQAIANPTPVNFGNVLVNTTSTAMTVTLTNPGTDTLNLAGTNTAALSGTNQADFAIVSGAGTTCTNGAQVQPNKSCTISLTFKPTSTSAETATLTITDDASPTTQTVTLNGTGTNATAFLNPSPVNFGNRRKGTTSATVTVTLTNIGSSSITLSSTPSTSGSNAADFAIVSGPGTTCTNGATLAATNGTCTIAVTFTPGTAGAETATLTVTDNAQPGTQSVTLNGIGIFPAVSLSANSLTFGNQIITTTSASKSITVTNTGTDVLNFAASNAVVLSGTNSTDFANATGTTCANSTALAVNASCVINIAFTPPAAGARGPAALTLTDDVAPAQTVTLSGTGVTPPTATLSTNTLNFNNQRVNVTSAKQTVTVTNSGGATLNIATVALGGTDATSFAIAGTSTCTNSSMVIGGGSCTIDVTFDPTKLGALTATITLTDNANATGTPGSTQAITLNGSGVAPAVSLAPASLQFNTQRQGTTSASQTITLTNSGTDTLNFAATNALSFTGPNAGDFAIAAGTTCANGGTVLKGANCLIKVTFTPTATGARSSSLNIADDAANNPQTVAVRGTGIFPAVTLSPPAPTVTFPATAVNSTAAAISVTLTNSGTDTLNLAASSAVAISGTGAAAFAVAAGNTCTNGLAISSAPSNNTCTLSFTFKPTAAGAFTATVTITDDVFPAQTITLNGATPATASLSTNTVSFGNQGVATASAPQTVTVSNTGGVALTFSAAPAISGTNAADFAIASTGTTCANGGNVAPGASCTVNLTFTPGAAGPRGAATLTFTDNAGGTSGATQTVSLSGTGIDFSVSSTTPMPAAAGTAITATVTITPGAGGFPNAVTFSASNLPPASTAAFNPPSVTPGNANATTQVTLNTTIRGGAVPGHKQPQVPGPLALKLLATALLALLTVLTMRKAARTQRWAAYLPVIVLLLAATVISGCTTAAQGTPAGTYPVTVTATSGSVTHTVTVTVTVQ